jgi:hypothetical protein
MDWLPEGHLAYFVLEIVRELDLAAIEAVIRKAVIMVRSGGMIRVGAHHPHP